MRRLIERSAWLLAALLSVPGMVLLYMRLWPCFIAARSIPGLPLFVSGAIAPAYLLLTADSHRTVLRRLGASILVASVWAALIAFFVANETGAMDRSRQIRSMANVRAVASIISGISREIPLSPVASLTE